MQIYIARPGDSLSGLARRFGVSAGELVRINQLGDPCRLTAGLALAVPSDTEPPKKALELSAAPDISAPDAMLEELIPGLSYVFPFCRTALPDGSLSPASDSRILRRAADCGVRPLLTVANLDEDGGYSAALAHALLGSDASRQALLNTILDALGADGYGGVHLSFCYLHPFDRENYNAFLRLASPALHAGGWYLSTALAPKEDDSERSLLCSAHDYAVHGEYADRMILLAYDWGYAYSAPQAVSPVNRIRAVLDYAAGKLPLGKVSLAISGHGYSWGLPWRLGDRGSAVSHSWAANLAVASGAMVKLDALSQSSWFTYTDAANKRHVVWYEDLRSLAARLRLVEDYGLAGLCFMGGSRLDRSAHSYVRSLYIPETLPV